MSKKKERSRFSSAKRTEAVLRLLRGEELDALSLELGVTAATLSSWREAFLAAGQAGLKMRESTASDDENLRLKALVGDLTMRLEVSRDAVRASGEPPNGAEEVERMSRTVLPSTKRAYGVALVSSEWQIPRSSFYEGAGAAAWAPNATQRRGPARAHSRSARLGGVALRAI